MNSSKRRIEQIKAKLSQIDKNVSHNVKQNSVSLVDLVNNTSQKSQSKYTVSQSQRTLDKSRCVNLDSTNNRFYDEAKNKIQMKQQMEEEVAKGYKRIANRRKINEHSAQILSERMNTNIAVAILNADQELTKRLEFEQVGKVLSDLQVFSIISFNENFEGRLISTTGHPKRQ